MSGKLKLAEMLCTRFCHDIIGPVGALNNGAEFLREEMRDTQSQAADLIESSAKEAVARVQFYRQAYGLVPAGSPASLSETRELAAEYFAAGKIKLDWAEAFTDASNIYPTQPQKKLIMNLLIIASATLIRGGSIKFEIDNNKAIITSKGEKGALSENFEACLAGRASEENIDPRLVQCYYTYVLAQDAGIEISIEKTSDGAVFSITLQ